MAENLLDLVYFRFRLLHIFLRILHVSNLQRFLRQRQFIARTLLRGGDIGARLLRQRRDARVHFIVARLKLVEFLMLQGRELRDGCHGLARGLLGGAMIRLRV